MARPHARYGVPEGAVDGISVQAVEGHIAHGGEGQRALRSGQNGNERGGKASLVVR